MLPFVLITNSATGNTSSSGWCLQQWQHDRKQVSGASFLVL
jgi:hypothetical protein